jgi:hypothetical protein
MIYLDTSVALAELLVEDRRPPEALWRQPLISSRLLEYELWTRIHARKAWRTHGDAVRDLLARVSLVELGPTVLARAVEAFPVPVRTLDALHLATIHFLLSREQEVALASHDPRMIECAEKLGIRLADW